MVDLAIFGVTMRCGSTLVQRAFNLNPETFVWGENGRLLMHYAKLYSEARDFCRVGETERKQYLEAGRLSNVFIGNMNPDWIQVQEALESGMKTSLSAIYVRDPHKRVGFKEVSHEVAAISLLRVLYPEVAIYLCARNPIDTWRSLQSWKLPPVERWIRVWYERLTQYEAFPDSVAFFWHEELLCLPHGLEPLAKAAGVDLAQVQQLVQLGRVGGTNEEKKQATPSKDLEVIKRYLLNVTAGSVRTKVLEMCQLAGYQI